MKCTATLKGFRLLPTHDPRTLECELEEGHEGYHWDDVQPWPSANEAFVGRPFLVAGQLVRLALLPNSHVGIRLHGGFCRGELFGKDCMLRWNHFGPHAYPGKIWADHLCRPGPRVDFMGAGN